MSFFSRQHFELLQKWHGQRKIRGDVEHDLAYSELSEAYTLVKRWAESLQKSLFLEGYVSINRKPTNQAQHFASYLWGKVYPHEDSPKALAYTVGINTEGLDLKIDTVGLSDKDPIRLKYLALRGDYSRSGFVSELPLDECLTMNFEQLLNWSKAQI